jgi:hypothetical protein
LTRAAASKCYTDPRTIVPLTGVDAVVASSSAHPTRFVFEVSKHTTQQQQQQQKKKKKKKKTIDF